MHTDDGWRGRLTGELIVGDIAPGPLADAIPVILVARASRILCSVANGAEISGSAARRSAADTGLP